MKDLLYLKDEQIKDFIQLLFYAYRETFSDPKEVLAKKFFGLAHLRSLNLIERNPGISLGELMFKLKVTKQSLNRVLRDLITSKMIKQIKDENDTRKKNLYLDKEGKVIMPSAKNRDVEYAKPFEIDPSDTLIMARGIGTSAKSGNRSWGDMCKVFEYEGYTVINSTECHNICNDKWMNNLIFKRENFNTPKTVRINHPEGAKWALEELGADFPLILKTAAGSRGIGVMWIESEKALHGLVQLLYREDEYIDILIQEYIKTDYDVRVIVCAGKILGAIKRPIVADDYRSNVSQGSEPELHELTEIEASESIRAADAVGGLLTGVDFIPAKNREKDKPYFIEVNSTPGLM